MIGAKIIRVKVSNKVIPEMLPQSGPNGRNRQVSVQ